MLYQIFWITTLLVRTKAFVIAAVTASISLSHSSLSIQELCRLSVSCSIQFIHSFRFNSFAFDSKQQVEDVRVVFQCFQPKPIQILAQSMIVALERRSFTSERKEEENSIDLAPLKQLYKTLGLSSVSLSTVSFDVRSKSYPLSAIRRHQSIDK